MLVILLVFVCGAAAFNCGCDPAGNRTGPMLLTTSAGAPVGKRHATNTLNTSLLRNQYFLETLTQFLREKIPERVVHARGAGAFGYFEVTHDVTDIFKSKLFSNIGKKTPVAIRFSIINGEKGTSDLSRGTRGLAVKFYTEEGNFDLVGINNPVFVFKDPLLFTAFSKAANKNSASHLSDANALWEFLTSHPETLFQFFFIFGDYGIPDGYRHIPGYSIHTFQVANQKGDIYFVRYHVRPNAGLKTITPMDAKKIGDPDYAIRDLYRAIEKGNYPSWNVSIQVLSFEDVKTAGFDVFDISKILPLSKYPLRPVGIITLNRNPKNYDAEIERLAFSPSNYVNGMYGAPDKIFEARRLSYRDAQYYRLGVNFNKITVNCPFQSKAFTYNRDSVAPVDDNGGGSPNYFPNLFNGPQPYEDEDNIELIQLEQDSAAQNFEQARDWYLYQMTEDEKSRLIKGIVGSLSFATRDLQDRAVEQYSRIYQDFGSRIQKGLNSIRAK